MLRAGRIWALPSYSGSDHGDSTHPGRKGPQDGPGRDVSSSGQAVISSHVRLGEVVGEVFHAVVPEDEELSLVDAGVEPDVAPVNCFGALILDRIVGDVVQ